MFLKKSKFFFLALVMTFSLASQVQAADLIIGNPGEELRNAVAKGDEQKVILLLDKNKNVIDKKDTYGNTALMIATEQGNLNLVRILVNMGADISITNKDGKTAEDIAMQQNRGAGLSVINRDGKTAESNDRMDIVNVLRQAGASHPAFKFNASAVYNFWEPEGIKGADYKTTGFASTSLEARFSPSVILHKAVGDVATLLPNQLQKEYVLRYEFTPNNSADQSQLIAAMNKDNGSALKKWFVNIPIMENDKGYYSLSYDSQYFITNVKVNDRKVYVKQDGTFLLLGPGWSQAAQNQYGAAVGNISSMTKFREIGVDFSEKNQKITDGVMKMGLFYLDYQKPYALTMTQNNIQSQDSFSIYDAKFQAIGLKAQMISNPVKTGWFNDLGFHFGLGKITLSGDTTVNDLLNEDETLYYLAVNGTYGYRMAKNNSSYQLYVKGDWRDFYSASKNDDSGKESITFNNDLIWSINANYQYKF